MGEQREAGGRREGRGRGKARGGGCSNMSLPSGTARSAAAAPSSLTPAHDYFTPFTSLHPPARPVKSPRRRLALPLAAPLRLSSWSGPPSGTSESISESSCKACSGFCPAEGGMGRGCGRDGMHGGGVGGMWRKI